MLNFRGMTLEKHFFTLEKHILGKIFSTLFLFLRVQPFIPLKINGWFPEKKNYQFRKSRNLNQLNQLSMTEPTLHDCLGSKCEKKPGCNMFQLEQEKGLKAESVEPTPKNPLKPWRQQSLRLQKQKPLLIAGASNMSQL